MKHLASIIYRYIFKKMFSEKLEKQFRGYMQETLGGNTKYKVTLNGEVKK